MDSEEIKGLLRQAEVQVMDDKKIEELLRQAFEKAVKVADGMLDKETYEMIHGTPEQNLAAAKKYAAAAACPVNRKIADSIIFTDGAGVNEAACILCESLEVTSVIPDTEAQKRMDKKTLQALKGCREKDMKLLKKRTQIKTSGRCIKDNFTHENGAENDSDALTK